MNVSVAPKVPELFDDDAEKMILGTCLADSGAYWAVQDYLRGPDFYFPAHERLFEAIADKRDRNEPATPITLKAFAFADPEIKELGGQAYLKDIAGTAVSVRNLRPVLRAVQSLARRRALVDTAREILDDAYFSDQEPDVICDRACEELYEAAHHTEPGSGPQNIEALIHKVAQAAEDAKNNPERTYITTGLRALDDALGGLFPGALTVLGAAPSMGKSGLVAQILESAGRAGKCGLMFSKEMGVEELGFRYLAQSAATSAFRIETGKISDDEMAKIAMAPERFRGLPIWIDGAPNLSTAQIRARTQSLRRQAGKIDLIVVDHLRFIEPADKRAEERDQLQQITRDLKRLAKEIGVAVLLVSHLNREFWRRNSKRPLTSDLYGSSAIEQNADHIWFLHREEFYLERDKPDQSDEKSYGGWLTKMGTHEGKAEVFSAKRRSGPLGSATVKFDAKLVRFSDLEDAAPVDAQGLFV